MSDDSDINSSRNRKKRKTLLINDDSSDSSSSIETTRRKRKKHKRCIQDSDSESDSSIEVVHKKRIGRVTSDTDQSSSGSEIVRSRRTVTLASDSSSDSDFDSDWITEPETENKPPEINQPAVKNESSSESGDDQLEKCPICLLPFKKQEVGSPESCDHSFCIDCILEWSKNINTCPVDRQIYNLILVRSNYNGKIIKQIPIESPQPQNTVNEIVEDPTFCEICGSSEREDRMLLCDGCDLGFHLECLDPPLEDVPAGLWFCPDCGPGDEDNAVDIYEVHLLLEDAETLGWPSGPRSRNTATRLVPRTLQSERVRARIITHRSQRQRTDNVLQGNADQRNRSQPGPSASSNRNRSASNRPTRRKKKRSKVKITYEIDQVTGERIAIETKIRRRKRKGRNRRESRRARMAAQAAKSVKTRLAQQLGMCPPKMMGQNLPDVRVSQNANAIGVQRSQAGIPALHLFGQRDDFDYFGGTDSEEDISSSNMLIRRRPQSSDVSLFRRAARRKAIVAPVQQPASTNILDSILDIQSKFHSRNSVMSLNNDGSIKIDSKNPTNINNSNKIINNNTSERNKEKINLNDYTNAYFRQTPMYGNGSPTSQSTYRNDADFSRRDSLENRNAVITSSEQVLHGSFSNDRDDNRPGYSIPQVCSSYDYEADKKEKDKDKSRSNTPGTHSDSELDIYSDIETVSTSRAEEFDVKCSSPAAATPNTPTDEDANNSDVDLIIDTEKADDSKEQVTSTVDFSVPPPLLPPPLPPQLLMDCDSDPEIQNQTVQSTNSKIGDEKEKDEDDDDSEDGCPNFSIYSSESISIAKTTELQLLSEQGLSADKPEAINENPINFEPSTSEIGSNAATSPNDLDNCIIPAEELVEEKEEKKQKEKYSYSKSGSMHCGLYSDSDDETLVKINKLPFNSEDKAEEPELSMLDKNEEEVEKEEDGTTPPIDDDGAKTKNQCPLGDISNMTEDISEEERSYTPCLDERTQKQGLEGLDTEMISDEDRNDFDESHELKTASDGDALEINAKESELDFSKPDDYEEGEIVDKSKQKKQTTEETGTPPIEKEPEPEEPNKATENVKESDPPASFKKLSKSNKERNYRDKDKENEHRGKSKERKSDKENRKERKREKRKELERYNVRSMIAEKPRRSMRDKFGRDESRRRSHSRSSRSQTPPVRRSPSKARSLSKEKTKKRRARTKSRSRTPQQERRRSRSPRPRRQRSLSRERFRRNWRNRSKEKTTRQQSASPRRRRDWVRRSWSRTMSRSYTPEQRLTPSWTPPRLLEAQPVKPQNLTVILNNDHNKKKKDKRKKDRRKELDKAKKRKRRTPPPSKEVFASGNNILVSVSFNKDKNQRDVTNKRKRDLMEENAAKKARKTKERRTKIDNKRKKKRKDLTGVKPVAIIDLERSPFREVTPSPEDVIVLTDSENAESNDMLGLQKVICDSSQQVASPERSISTNYLTGPKTPPEPQVKFTLSAKQTQIRAISNPLHEPDELENEIDPQEELEQRLNDSLHKGPNTPPEPPNSPPSSPDAYDPFEPTKSRSPTPEPIPPAVQLSSTSQNDSVREESLIDSRNGDDETIDQSHTPPVTDIQPADSQSSNIKPSSPPEKSPSEQHISVVINRVVQSQAAIFPTVTSKTVQSFSNTSLVTSTPLVPPRINILNSTVLTPTTIASSLPQRIVLPNTTKSSPVKVSPNKLPIKSTPIKSTPIKSTPIKPMPSKNLMNKSNKASRKSNGNENVDLLDFESPYSPGSSDYEDLFEPPPPNEVSMNKSSNKQSGQKGNKDQSTFDILFGTSPVNNCFKPTKTKKQGGNNASKYKKNVKGTKQVGVKVDEDTLKILDELPNSAVEMQVKYKYLKKLNRQERVVEEVKLVLKPHYNKKHINKEEYKDILRRSVPKICHNKSGEINPQKIQNLIEAYVKKIRHSKKVTSSSQVNTQKA